MSDIRFRRCTICDQAFEVPRSIGRPAEKCSQACRREAARRQQHAYIRRLIEARDQLSQLRAA